MWAAINDLLSPSWHFSKTDFCIGARRYFLEPVTSSINLFLAILYSTYFCPQSNGAREYEEKDACQLEGRIPSEFLHCLAEGKKNEAYLWILELPSLSDCFLLEL